MPAGHVVNASTELLSVTGAMDIATHIQELSENSRPAVMHGSFLHVLYMSASHFAASEKNVALISATAKHAERVVARSRPTLVRLDGCAPWSRIHRWPSG